MTTLRIQRLSHAVALPAYATARSAGMDLHAAVDGAVIVWPGQRELIPTGLRVAIPSGYEMQIRPRSGLALKDGITIPNTPGTIDEDFRGEVKVILLNTSTYRFTVTRGMRIAQAVIAPVVRVEIEEGELDETERGSGGFGSTGVSAACQKSSEIASESRSVPTHPDPNYYRDSSI